MARPREPILSQRRIVEVALEILDSGGPDALSTRRLARELGVRAPSLYNHFATKEEILDAVGEAIIGQVDLTMFARADRATADRATEDRAAADRATADRATEDWAAALAEWARGYRRALAAHPNAVPFVARGPALRPAALALADAVYGALVDAGWPPSYATRIGATMRYFVAGSALGSFAQGFVDDPRVYAERYPHLHDAHRLREHRQQVDDGAFELGLASLLGGLTALYPTVARRP